MQRWLTLWYDRCMATTVHELNSRDVVGIDDACKLLGVCRLTVARTYRIFDPDPQPGKVRGYRLTEHPRGKVLYDLDDLLAIVRHRSETDRLNGELLRREADLRKRGAA